MRTTTRYITYVSKSLHWVWTKPRGNPLASFESAENMVCAKLMEEKGIERNFPNFGKVLRKEFPEIVAEAQQYIGETREVELLDGEKPSEFQRKFHEVQFESEDKIEEEVE